MSQLKQPEAGEYNPYYATYIQLVDSDVHQLLHQQLQDLSNLLESTSDEELNFRYAPGKWSLREVIVHINDTERIFAYRSLSVGRGEEKDHPGFDQNDFIDHSDFSHLTAYDLLKDFNAVRMATLTLFDNMTEEQNHKIGTVNGEAYMANSGAYIIAGHFAHHMNVIKAKYLK